LLDTVKDLQKWYILGALQDGIGKVFLMLLFSSTALTIWHVSHRSLSGIQMLKSEHLHFFVINRVRVWQPIAMVTNSLLFSIYLQPFLELPLVKYLQSWQFCENCFGKRFNWKSCSGSFLDIIKFNTFNNKKRNPQNFLKN